MNLIEREGSSAIQGLMMMLMMMMLMMMRLMMMLLMMMLMMLMMMLLMSRMKTCLRYNGMPHLVFGSHIKYRSVYVYGAPNIYFDWGLG